MSLPDCPLYPDEFDTVTNLYQVYDSLKVTLAEDYLPGQTSIVVAGDATAFPPTGIITLTEQQSDIGLRAVSFFYTGRTATGFTGLTLYPGFEDAAKPKRIRFKALK